MSASHPPKPIRVWITRRLFPGSHVQLLMTIADILSISARSKSMEGETRYRGGGEDYRIP